MTRRDHQAQTRPISGREPGLGRQDAELARSPGLGGGAGLLRTLEAMADEDWQIRMRAVEALGQMSSEQALDSLAQAMQDASSGVRERAAAALGRLGSEEALSILLNAQNADGTPRSVAAIGLAHFPRREAIEHLVVSLAISRDDGRQEVIDALVQIGSMAVPWLVDALQDPNISVISGALDALGRIGGQMKDEKERGRYFDVVVPFIKHEEYYQVRNSAYLAIGRLRDPRSLPLLTGSWSQGVYDTTALRGVGALGEIALPTILEAMLSDEYYLRERGSRALYFLAADAVASLVAQIAELSPKRRRIFLSRIQSLNEAATVALKELLSGANRSLQLTAATIFGAMAASRVQIAEVGADAALQHLDPEVRGRAAREIANHPCYYYEGVPALIALAQDVDQHVRVAGCRILGWQLRLEWGRGQVPGWHHQVEPVLINALSDEYLGVRLAAVRSLRYTRSEEGAEALIDVLRGPERELHAAAAESLHNMRGEGVVSVLIEALGDSYTAPTRRKAARSLADQRSVSGILPLLAAMADRNHNVRLAAARALGILVRQLRWEDREAAIETLREGLGHDSWVVRLHAAYNLVYLEDAASAYVLRSALQDEELSLRFLTPQAIEQVLERI
ncbi:MAG: HEAT repeat domain-containing protein [Anaerolineae bacterium]|nr:HEAT repeat domain-containing protein [Anaerolineae bacterium]